MSSNASDAQWYFLARERSHALAVEMVRLEHLADAFESNRQYTQADLVRWDRDGVRQERSSLMRELWQRRRIVTPHNPMNTPDPMSSR